MNVAAYKLFYDEEELLKFYDPDNFKSETWSDEESLDISYDDESRDLVKSNLTTNDLGRKTIMH